MSSSPSGWFVQCAPFVDELREVEVRRDGERAVVDEELADRADALDVAGRVVREGMADVDAATTTRLDATTAHQRGGGVVQAVQHLGVGLARVVAAVVEAPRTVLATALREAAEERVADLPFIHREPGDDTARAHALHETPRDLERAPCIGERTMRMRALEPEQLRERIERHRRQLAGDDQRPREARGVEPVVVDVRQREPGTSKAGLEEGPVEADVVAGDESAVEERRHLEQRLAERERVLPRRCREAVDRQRVELRLTETLGRDERLVLVQHLQRARVDADDAELDDVVPRRIEPGGLEVDEGDGRLRRPACEAHERRGG
jgi:hypothetical protein